MKMIMSALGKVMGSLEYRLSQTRWAHFTVSAALSRAIDPPSEAHCLEDFGTFGFARSPDGLMGITQDQCHHQEWEMERLSPSGSMQLMAVPKRKVTPHRKGIRNGPKALKPAPVIIRCKDIVVALKFLARYSDMLCDSARVRSAAFS
eukprot:Gb_17105 [translate_table: standard]